MSAGELAVLRAGVADLLFMRMDVYAEGQASGEFDDLVSGGVACLLYEDTLTRQSPRAEDVDTRRLLFDPAYTLASEHSQVEIGGQRWQVVVGSVGSKAVQAGVLVNACRVERVGG